MNSYEKLAVLTAIDKAVKPALKDVRADVQADMLADGSERKKLIVGGCEVGKVTIPQGKPKWVVTDEAAFMDFAVGNGLADSVAKIDHANDLPLLWLLDQLLGDGVIDCETYRMHVKRENVLKPDWDRYFDLVDGHAVMYGTSEMVPGVELQQAEPGAVRVTNLDAQHVIKAISAEGIAGYLS